MEEKYCDYLKDESKYSGQAVSISFPTKKEDMIKIIHQMQKENTGITIQGGRSGIVGGCVPNGGHIMNLSSYRRILSEEQRADGTALLRVEAGITLMDLNMEISKRYKNQLHWPVQPSETSATVGGILASGAKGINAFHYGECNHYVESVLMILADGTLSQVSDPKTLDQIIGGEGRYGVIAEATLILHPQREAVWGISFFFEQEENAWRFCDEIRGEKRKAERSKSWIEAAEYLDVHSIQMIEQQKPYMSKIKDIPDIALGVNAMVYLELSGEEEGIEELAYFCMDAAAQCGANPDEAWAVTGEAEVEKMHAFRHAAAETVNMYIEQMTQKYPTITKLGTDMSVKGESFENVMKMYLSDLRDNGVPHCMFGHIDDSHLHVNILPESLECYELGKELIGKWAKQINEKQGCVASENGIGKLKKEFSCLCYSPEERQSMIALKEELDPDGLWNKGNVF